MWFLRIESESVTSKYEDSSKENEVQSFSQAFLFYKIESVGI